MLRDLRNLIKLWGKLQKKDTDCSSIDADGAVLENQFLKAAWFPQYYIWGEKYLESAPSRVVYTLERRGWCILFWDTEGFEPTWEPTPIFKGLRPNHSATRVYTIGTAWFSYTCDGKPCRTNRIYMSGRVVRAEGLWWSEIAPTWVWISPYLNAKHFSQIQSYREDMSLQVYERVGPGSCLLWCPPHSCTTDCHAGSFWILFMRVRDSEVGFCCVSVTTCQTNNSWTIWTE